MARKWRPNPQRLLEFPPDTVPLHEPPAESIVHPEGSGNAIQDDHPRIAGATTGDIRPASEPAEPPAGPGTIRSGVEGQPRSVEGTSLPVEGRKRPEPDFGGGAGDGASGDGEKFVLRSSGGGSRATPGRGDGGYSPNFTTRIKASRGQRQLNFDAPSPVEPLAASKPPELDAIASPLVGDSERIRSPKLPGLNPSSPHGPRQAEPVPIASGEKSKARDVLNAIRILKAVEEENRLASEEEKRALARFSGFGAVALSLFPDPVTGHYKDATWQVLGGELETLLTRDEYDSAKRTTFNAFYTSPRVIAAMHAALRRLGVPDAATILEPGCGIGNFMRQDQASHRFIGIELDGISGRIARTLNPGQEIRIENFRDTRLPESSVDAVIGNVPFADLKLDYQGQKLSLHDFFFAKSLDAVKPGGVLALVTSHYTLDKQNAAVRELLADKADFLGAIRLPSDAFKREGTAVVTDIVFLRKRVKGETPNHIDSQWLGAAPLSIEGIDIPINRYFLNHPEMVLGTWSRKDTLYGGNSGYSLLGNGELELQLAQAVGRLPEFAPSPLSSSDVPTNFRPPASLPHIGEGTFFVGGDRIICQSLGGLGVPVHYGGALLKSDGTLTGKRIGGLIGLRDRARRVLQSQNEGWPTADRDGARQELNRAYNLFVAAYGPINKTTFGETASGSVIRRMPNLVKFREDPDAMLVMSLEDYDETTGKATKAAIMQKDVVGRTPPITAVSSAEEGLLVCLDQRGGVDLPFIAALYGKTEDEIITELGDLIFQDPESGDWQTADAYLSGNVRAKLMTAESAGVAFTRNAEALRKVQPEDVLPGDIDAKLGSPWIPEADIEAFAADLFRVAPSAVRIGHLKKDAVWSVDADYAAERSVAATSEYGTERANGAGLFELALNMKTPLIYDTVYSGDREERVVNQEATLAAREKQKLIKERFRSWVFADAERTERLVRLYNGTYNNLRPRLFDGSHLEFPAMNETIELRPHQTAAIWRGMSAGNTLLAHAVGAGKSFTMAATAIKMKDAGLIKKPMIVVPNHLLEQFAREFMQLYPNARLLVASKDDMTRENRKHLTAKIASGEWDGIIVTHSSFERIGMSRDYQARFLREQIEEYDQLLRDSAAADKSKVRRNLIKTIEKQKAKREERLKDLLAQDKKDDGLVFDELGVDHLFIDEAHYFKNLETPTKMERVAGIQTGGSERAFDLFMKARYLHEQHSGHGLTFATGTPISNTMVEMYTMQRFLDLEGLLDRGIEHFDAWAATFGEVVDTMEISPDGASLRPRSRFARFTNIPELQQMFRAFSDVQTSEMLDLPRPLLSGGKPTVVASPMSEEQAELQDELVERYDRLRSQKVDPRQDNALAITTDGRKLALDARMLLAEASDFPDSKINAMVSNVYAVWQRTASNRGTQMIFCDMGVNPTEWGYSAYDEIAEKLITSGIPRAQIAMIGDADSDAKKQALFDKVRIGAVRVLIGSTQKMGTGTNVQKRLAALHHLDAPWKPAEVEQREGRILRQGNENEEVAIYRYVTEGSFDAYMWQALETKARFISQIMTGDNAVRSADDIGGQELSYAEVKAIASGNPAVLTLAEADAELQRLSVLKKNHADEQFLARRNIRSLPETINRLSERSTALDSDRTTAADCARDPALIGNQACGRDDMLARLGDYLDSLPKTPSRHETPLGIYHGLEFGLILDPRNAPDLYLQGTTRRVTMLSREHHGPRAIINGLERLVGSYKTDCGSVQQELEIAQGQLRDYESRIGQPFPYDAYSSELTRLRDELKAGLSGTSPQPCIDSIPAAGAIAEQIKAVIAANVITTASERTERRPLSAEEPIMARIHRRRAAEAVAAAPVQDSTGDVQWAAKPQATFKERVSHPTRHYEYETSIP